MFWFEREYPSVPIDPHDVAAILETISEWATAEVQSPSGEVNLEHPKYLVSERSEFEVEVSLLPDKEEWLMCHGQCPYIAGESWFCESWSWEREEAWLLDAIEPLVSAGYTTRFMPVIGCNEAAGCDNSRLIVTRRGHAPLPDGVKVLTEEELADE
jgi:hypothetical protein